MKKCEKCGSVMQDNLKFCQECGNPLENRKNLCGKCGTEIKENMSFCMECGNRAEETQAEPLNTVEEKTPTLPEYDTPEKNSIETDNEKPGKKPGNTAFFIAIITSVLVFIILGLIIYSMNKDISYLSDRNETLEQRNRSLRSIERDYEDIQKNYSELQRNHQEISNVKAIMITSVKFANVTNQGEIINEAGTRLTSSQMRYLRPVITFNSTFSEDVTFNIKIIDPNGVIFRNQDTSPTGYSVAATVSVNRGNNQTRNLSGWGIQTSSLYRAGEWTVEIWYNNMCLASEKVRFY